MARNLSKICRIKDPHGQQRRDYQTCKTVSASTTPFFDLRRRAEAEARKPESPRQHRARAVVPKRRLAFGCTKKAGDHHAGRRGHLPAARHRKPTPNSLRDADPQHALRCPAACSWTRSPRRTAKSPTPPKTPLNLSRDSTKATGPVITLVLCFGSDPWDGPRDLHSMMRTRPEFLRFVPKPHKYYAIPPRADRIRHPFSRLPLQKK